MSAMLTRLPGPEGRERGRRAEGMEPCPRCGAVTTETRLLLPMRLSSRRGPESAG